MKSARLEARAISLRKAVSTGPTGAHFEALFFLVATERYALRMADVEAVHPFTDYASVPGAPPYIRGVAHLEGEILSLLDLALLFGTSAQGITDLRRAIVIGKSPRRLAVLASDVEEIARVPAETIRPSPGAVVTGRAWSEGVIGGDRLLLSAQSILEGIQSEVKGK